MKRIPRLRLFGLLCLGLGSLQAVEISNLEGTVIDVDILQTEDSRIQTIGFSVAAPTLPHSTAREAKPSA